MKKQLDDLMNTPAFANGWTPRQMITEWEKQKDDWRWSDANPLVSMTRFMCQTLGIYDCNIR